MIYFSDVFGVDQSLLEAHGAFNIALVNDLPLFVDPFLLFDSERPELRELHDGIIRYLVFVRDRAQAEELTEGAISQWLFFREVKQNWLGFSRQGNSGTGLGRHFADALARNFKRVFRNFGDETITKSSHLEKLGLLSGGVGSTVHRHAQLADGTRRQADSSVCIEPFPSRRFGFEQRAPPFDKAQNRLLHVPHS